MKLTHILFNVFLCLAATTATYSMNFTIEDNLDSEVTLVSCDGQQFRISVKKANHLITVRHLIEDNGINELIPLPNVTGVTLVHVVEALSHLEDQEAAPLEANEAPRPEHVKALLEKFKDLQPAQIKELFITANYLDFQGLMHATGALFGKWLMTTEWDFTDPMFQGITNALGLFIIDRLFEYVHLIAPDKTALCKQLGNALIEARKDGQTLTFKQCLTYIKLIKGLIKPEALRNLHENYRIKNTTIEEVDTIFNVVEFGTCSLVTLYCNEAQKAGTLLELLNAKDQDNGTVLMWAALSENLKVFTFIFEQLKALNIEKQHLNAKDQDNGTVLMWAALSENLKVVTFIFEQLKALNMHHQHLDAKDKYNKTVLMWAAAQSGNLDVIIFIFEQLKALNMHHQHLDAKDKYNKTALMYAALSDNLDVVTFIFEQLKALKIEQSHLNAKDVRSKTVLMYAALSGKLEVVTFIFAQLKALNLHQQHLDAKNQNNETVLIYAAESGDLGVLKFIFNQLEDLKIELQHLDTRDKHNRTVLMYATRSGSLDVVMFIFDQLKDFKIEFQHLDATNTFNETVLMWAAHNRNNPKYTAIAHYLLDRGAELNKRDREEEEQQEHNKRQKRENNNDENK